MSHNFNVRDYVIRKRYPLKISLRETFTTPCIWNQGDYPICNPIAVADTLSLFMGLDPGVKLDVVLSPQDLINNTNYISQSSVWDHVTTKGVHTLKDYPFVRLSDEVKPGDLGYVRDQFVPPGQIVGQGHVAPAHGQVLPGRGPIYKCPGPTYGYKEVIWYAQQMPLIQKTIVDYLSGVCFKDATLPLVGTLYADSSFADWDSLTCRLPYEAKTLIRGTNHAVVVTGYDFTSRDSQLHYWEIKSESKRIWGDGGFGRAALTSIIQVIAPKPGTFFCKSDGESSGNQ